MTAFSIGTTVMQTILMCKKCSFPSAGEGSNLGD